MPKRSNQRIVDIGFSFCRACNRTTEWIAKELFADGVVIVHYTDMRVPGALRLDAQASPLLIIYVRFAELS